QARLLFPEDFDAARQYPLVLEIHGGPNGRFSDSYDVAQQILRGQGYLVLAVNPRGSSSYGPAFLKAVLRDWGGEDFLDLMAAVDLVSERPYVDTNRLGVHGYSYGGYMSSWIIGHDHRFKAAVIGAPCINLHSMYGTSDIGVSFGENQWGGSSIKDVQALLERSPLTFAPAVQTPALLLHGEQDYRCPIEQSEQFFVALKRQSKDVELVRFPDSAHGFPQAAHPRLREQYYQRMVDWFARYLG
ncbi:MAG: S9 family peptidase, partial [Gemmatimonadetes bacterium]|nr:S9 family peptidase [Gemmatimonadota bacterium]